METDESFVGLSNVFHMTRCTNVFSIKLLLLQLLNGKYVINLTNPVACKRRNCKSHSLTVGRIKVITGAG